MSKITIHYTPHWQKYQADIDLESGKVFYKTNTLNPPQFYECFFLVSGERLSQFAQKLDVLEQWQPSYDNGICIDGESWSIKLSVDSEKEIYGVNGQPEGFGEFIEEVERLLQKDFGSWYNRER